MENKVFGEEYEVKFDPKEYLSQFYNKDSFMLHQGGFVRKLHGIFSAMEPSPDGKLLDLGCGPTIHGVLSASRVYKDITLSEYTEANRGAVEKWLRRDPDAFNWTYFLEFVAGLEGVSSEDIANRVRLAIKEVIPCDVRKKNILLDPARGPYDFIVSSLCLEAGCIDVMEYSRGMCSLAELMKPGGKLFLMGTLGESFYRIKDTRYHCLRIRQADMMEAVKEAGLKMESFSMVHLNQLDQVCDAEGQFFMLASKPQSK